MRYGLIFAALLWSIPASAQPIRGHPQKAAYASPSEWPELFDGQMHWPKFDGIQSEHCAHIIPKWPQGAELADQSFTVTFTLKLFHCDAWLTGFYGEGFRDVKLDGAVIPFKGDPTKLITLTGSATFDPLLPAFGRFHHPHGWTNPRLEASFVFANGDVGYHDFMMSYFSVSDLSETEALPPGNFGPIISIRNTMFPVSGTNFGNMVLEVEDWLPLLPIKAPWFFRVSAYNYTSTAPCCPNGLLEQRRDMDFHGGIPGTVVLSEPHDQLGVSAKTMVLDPATTTQGTHKDGLFWKSTFNNETVAALLVVTWTAGDSGTPLPQLCTDPKATNVGQPLPCIYPLPPMCSWNLIATGIRVNSCDAKRMQLCATSDPASCQEVVFK